MVVEWSKTKNWAYVVLSQVRSLDGLFLMEPIPEKIDFKPSDDYIYMMDDLRKTIAALLEQESNLVELY